MGYTFFLLQVVFCLSWNQFLIGIIFDHEEDVDLAELRFHSTENQVHESVCNDTNSDVEFSSLTSHIESVHEEKKSFNCTICDYKCFHKGSLTKHVRAIHEEKKAFHCSICDKKFQQNATFSNIYIWIE